MPGDLELGGSWLAAIATGLGVGGTALYKAWRKVKDDREGDRSAAKAETAWDKVIARMEAEITRQNGVILDLSAKVEKLTQEKDEANQKLAVALANELLLKGKVADLEKDMEELRARLTAQDTGDRRRATDYHPAPVDDRDKRELP